MRSQLLQPLCLSQISNAVKGGHVADISPPVGELKGVVSSAAVKATEQGATEDPGPDSAMHLVDEGRLTLSGDGYKTNISNIMCFSTQLQQPEHQICKAKISVEESVQQDGAVNSNLSSQSSGMGLSRAGAKTSTLVGSIQEEKIQQVTMIAGSSKIKTMDIGPASEVVASTATDSEEKFNIVPGLDSVETEAVVSR